MYEVIPLRMSLQSPDTSVTSQTCPRIFSWATAILIGTQRNELSPPASIPSVFRLFPSGITPGSDHKAYNRVSSSISLPPKPTTKRWEGSHSGPFPTSPSSLHLKPPTISELHSLHDNPHLLTCYNFQTCLSWVTEATRV